MSDNRIEERLASAIEQSTPDILDDLMAELGISSEPKENLRDAIAGDAQRNGRAWTPRRKAGKTKLLRTAMSCAAALIIIAAGISVFRDGRTPFAIVSLDVNPGIEMTIDDHEHVIDARAVNSEGEDILSGMDLKGSDINLACNAIVGSMLTRGYLSDLSNSILVSVSAKDRAAGTAVEKKLAEQLNNYLESSQVAAAILGQAVSDDEEISRFAEENSISIGKAWLIHDLMETGSTKMTEKDLLSLSTQELILLGQKREVASDVSYGNAESGKYIGSEKAIDIALEKAGADRASVSSLENEMDCENGVLIYEVSFRKGDYEYDCDVNAYDGSIVSFEKEYEGPPSSGGDIDDDEDDDDDDDEGDDDDDD